MKLHFNVTMDEERNRTGDEIAEAIQIVLSDYVPSVEVTFATSFDPNDPHGDAQVFHLDE